jgi:hypothetical protein
MLLKGIVIKQLLKIIKNQSMKQVITLLSLTLFAAGFTSCQKDDVQNESAAKKALTARTWQMEKVTGYTSGLPSVAYQRGAANNEDDYSLIRQTYKADGSIVYVGQFGEAGSDGSYELLNNDTRIKIGLNSMGLSIIGENLKVNATEFAYTLKHGDGDSTRFIFSPL